MHLSYSHKNDYRRTIKIVHSISVLIFGLALEGQEIQSFKNYSDYTYEQLKRRQDSAYRESNDVSLKDLIHFHTQKAVSENNTLERVRSYYYLTIIEPDSTAIKYSDSIIFYSSKLNHKGFPTLGYIQKADRLYQMGKFDQSLENYLIAYDLAIEKHYEDHIRLTSQMIAAIRNINGQPTQALHMYHKSLSIIKNSNAGYEENIDDVLLLAYNISLSYLRLQELDSAKYYNKFGLNYAIKAHDSMSIIDFKMVGAQIDFFEGNYARSKDTLQKYIEKYQEIDRAIKLYYLAKSHQKLGNHDQAILYYQIIDSIVSRKNDPFDEIKNVYQELILYASKKDNDQLQLEYIEKLLSYDSILNSYKANVFNSATADYDVPLLKLQKAKIQEKLESKEKWSVFFISMIVLAVVSIFYLIIKERRIKKRIQRLMGDQNVETKNSSPKHVEESIPEEIKIKLIDSLRHFETEKGFLNKQLDLPTLAQQLETNTSYLSMVINNYKGKSFPSYLKKLRIDYALKELSTNLELIKYNYQGLADIFGFKTGESFSKAFYSQTGVYPSNIIKELKKRSRNDHL